MEHITFSFIIFLFRINKGFCKHEIIFNESDLWKKNRISPQWYCHMDSGLQLYEFVNVISDQLDAILLRKRQEEDDTPCWRNDDIGSAANRSRSVVDIKESFLMAVYNHHCHGFALFNINIENSKKQNIQLSRLARPTFQTNSSKKIFQS